MAENRTLSEDIYHSFKKYIWYTLWIAVLDNDAWTLFLHGKTLLEKGFIQEDVFTIHEGFRSSINNWLGVLIFYGLYSFGGVQAVLSFCNMMASLFLAIYLIAYHRGNGRFRAFHQIAIMCTFGILHLYFTTRLQVFTYVNILLELICLEKWHSGLADRGRNKVLGMHDMLLTIPVLLSLLEMQVHGTQWPMLLAAAMPYCIDVPKDMIVRIRKDRWKPALMLAGMFLVGFINPSCPSRSSSR